MNPAGPPIGRGSLAPMVTVTLPSAPHRLDAETYERIVRSGALEGAHVELLDGVVVDMTPAIELHDELITRLNRYLVAADATLRVQMGLRVADDSIPEPDLALVDRGDYSQRRPSAALLVVEVALSSRELDQGRKAELYAGARIPTYWVVDGNERAVDALSEPGATGYQRRQTYRWGTHVPAPVAGLDPLDVAALFERR